MCIEFKIILTTGMNEWNARKSSFCIQSKCPCGKVEYQRINELLFQFLLPRPKIKFLIARCGNSFKMLIYAKISVSTATHTICDVSCAEEKIVKNRQKFNLNCSLNCNENFLYYRGQCEFYAAAFRILIQIFHSSDIFLKVAHTWKRRIANYWKMLMSF